MMVSIISASIMYIQLQFGWSRQQHVPRVGDFFCTSKLGPSIEGQSSELTSTFPLK